MNNPDWATQMTDWQEPHRQHDAAEFLMYVLGRTHFPAHDGQWAVYRGHRHLDDSSLQTSPLILNIGRHKTIQAMIQAWHQDEATSRYITAGPRIIVIQLTRFLVQQGRIRKSTAKVPIPDTVHIPTRTGDGAAVLSYRVVGGIYHLGPRAQVGHYRTFQLERTEASELRMWVTDDGRVPALATPADEATVRMNAYLLFCTVAEG